MTEQIFKEIAGDGFIFRHYQRRQIDPREVQLFVDLPELKLEAEDKVFILKALPRDIYQLHNLSDRDVCVMFDEDLAPKLKGRQVEIRINPVEEDSDLLLNKELKATFKEMTKSFTEMKRLFKKIRFKNQENKYNKKIVPKSDAGLKLKLQAAEAVCKAASEYSDFWCTEGSHKKAPNFNNCKLCAVHEALKKWKSAPDRKVDVKNPRVPEPHGATPPPS